MNVFHQKRRQRENLPDRQIDLAADQEHDFTAGDDHRCCDELGDRLHVRVGQKILVCDLEINDERHR